MTEETQLWIRMAIDRQLLALQHAQLLLPLDNALTLPQTLLGTLLADITHNLQQVQKFYSGTDGF